MRPPSVVDAASELFGAGEVGSALLSRKIPASDLLAPRPLPPPLDRSDEATVRRFVVEEFIRPEREGDDDVGNDDEDDEVEADRSRD